MQKQDLRIIFMGTPEFAVATLQRLIDREYNVVAVVTQPDKPVGRHQTQLQPSAVKTCALQHNIPVLQPEKMKDPDFLQQLAAYKADIQVVVAFRMLPEVVWNMPPMGTFNVHAALLPQYRGAAPINWAIINGEKQTGVTTFFLDKDIDTGRIITHRTFPIPDDADAEYVYDGLMQLGAEIATDTLDDIIEGNGKISSTDQTECIAEGQTLHDAPKIFKDTCRIDWSKTAKQVYDFVRGLSPYPCAWTNLKAEDQQFDFKVYKTRKTGQPCPDATPGTLYTDKLQLFVACADQWLEITELQPSGKRRMTARDFLNGNKNLVEAHCG